MGPRPCRLIPCAACLIAVSRSRSDSAAWVHLNQAGCVPSAQAPCAPRRIGEAVHDLPHHAAARPVAAAAGAGGRGGCPGRRGCRRRAAGGAPLRAAPHAVRPCPSNPKSLTLDLARRTSMAGSSVGGTFAAGLLMWLSAAPRSTVSTPWSSVRRASEWIEATKRWLACGSLAFSRRLHACMTQTVAPLVHASKILL